MRKFLVGLILATFMANGAATADGVAVIDATVTANPDGTYAFSATFKHGDTGWDHYADKFEVLGPGGKVLGTRVLYHPHVNEQPFTRSLSQVQVPVGVREVTVRAHDKVSTVTASTPSRSNCRPGAKRRLLSPWR